MTAPLTSAVIKQWARNIGFDLVGIAPALPVDHSEYVQQWLQTGCNGSMGYLANNTDQRLDPRKLLPGAKSIICVAMNYYTQSPDPPPAAAFCRIANYAQGRDYHLTIKEHLKLLAERIKKEASPDTRLRCCVDTVPIFEKAHAERAGLGWIGKNTLLLNETFGSWLVLGEIVTTLDLDADSPVPDRCGQCTRCLSACPTNALTAPRTLDARKCISYLTIESDSERPPDIVTHWLFGCDTCQQVCPYNMNTPITRHDDFLPKHNSMNLDQLLTMTHDEFTSEFNETPLARPGLDRLKMIAGDILKNDI